MYRKIYRLRSQIEHGEMDADQASMLLGSIFEQAEAAGNTDAVILSQLAGEWLDKHEWVKGGQPKDIFAEIAKDLREGTLLDDLELLTWALAEKDATSIEKYMIEKHKDDGYTFNDIEQYRDDGIVTEHFTLMGNVVIWFKDWWGEEDDPDGIINEVGFLGANGKPKIVDFWKTLGICNDGNHAEHLKVIMAELAKRGV